MSMPPDPYCRMGSGARRNTPARQGVCGWDDVDAGSGLASTVSTGGLLQGGFGTGQACRAVGIGRKTGYRWRAENGGNPPVRRAEPALSSRYLSLLERHQIGTSPGQSQGVTEIARWIGRSRSTVGRDLRRNLSPHGEDLYDGDLAHAGTTASPSTAKSPVGPGRGCAMR
jgi:hypothetical protein